VSTTLADLAEAYTGEAFASAETCPVCAHRSRVAHAAFNIHPDKARRFDFRVCRRCKHGWIDPMPSQGLLNYLYERGSYSVVGVGWADIDENSLTIPAQRVVHRELESRQPPGRYFELGVGKGALYRRFLQRGWQCAGVEPGAWGRTLQGVGTSFDGVPAAFAADVIVALDVLEHIADPVGTLRRLRDLCAPGARLYCAVPNRQSLRAVLGRHRWRMVRPLGHIHYWSKGSVVGALAGSGFAGMELHRTDLWEPRPIRSLREAAGAAVEHLGLGDQWIVLAQPASPQRSEMQA